MAYPLALAASALLFTARPSGAQVLTRRVALAAHALVRGEVLSADDITYRDTTVHAAGDTAEIVPGWVTRRTINAGEILRAPAVEPPNLVLANQPVEVEWRDGNVSLTLRGVATRNASMGSRVTVRTEDGHRVEATVVAPGRVRID